MYLLVVFVDFNVFVQISLLSKCLRAAFLITNKWPFFSMRSEVVKKVVPLSEDQIAVVVVTLHKSKPSACLRVLESKNSKAFRLWNYNMLEAYFTEVDLVSMLNNDSRVLNHSLNKLSVFGLRGLLLVLLKQLEI